MKLFYLLCAIAGTIIPYSQFVPLAIGVSCGLPLFLFLREKQSPALKFAEGK